MHAHRWARAVRSREPICAPPSDALPKRKAGEHCRPTPAEDLPLQPLVVGVTGDIDSLHGRCWRQHAASANGCTAAKGALLCARLVGAVWLRLLRRWRLLHGEGVGGYPLDGLNVTKRWCAGCERDCVLGAVRQRKRYPPPHHSWPACGAKPPANLESVLESLGRCCWHERNRNVAHLQGPRVLPGVATCLAL